MGSSQKIRRREHCSQKTNKNNSRPTHSKCNMDNIVINNNNNQQQSGEDNTHKDIPICQQTEQSPSSRSNQEGESAGWNNFFIVWNLAWLAAGVGMRTVGKTF